MDTIQAVVKHLFTLPPSPTPACILWTDGERQWEAAVPLLQKEMPTLFVLGSYAPELRRGPAIWLRCVIAGVVPELGLPQGAVPVIYLPGVARAQFRAVASAPDQIKPLIETQYRSLFWTQENGKDWTIAAFLKTERGGLGLDVAGDAATRDALLLALPKLMYEDVEQLKGKRIDSDFLNRFLVGPDPLRELLRWLCAPEQFKASASAPDWKAFVSFCVSTLRFNPEKDGAITGLTNFASRQGPWAAVWKRFCDSPERFAAIADQLRRLPLPAGDLLTTAETHGGWPQWNSAQEDALRRELQGLANSSPRKARAVIANLERDHRERRQLVWAQLAESPLANALEHLADLARRTANPCASAHLDSLEREYTTEGWKADCAMLQTLAAAAKCPEPQVILAPARLLYEEWADESAYALQSASVDKGYPWGSKQDARNSGGRDGECILFVDALRFDLAKALADELTKANARVEETPRWAALPTLTQTGKPAVSPVRHRIAGRKATEDFEPEAAETGTSLKGGQQLKRLLADEGWTMLDEPGALGLVGKGWLEFPDLDKTGHSDGWKAASRFEGLIRELAAQVVRLLYAGWQSVRVVTDHGWLLLPDGLKRVDLPTFLTVNKWGRCALLTDSASKGEKLLPWFWDPDQQFAFAPGISAYRAGMVFTHGGVSLQECLTLELKVTRQDAQPAKTRVSSAQWKNLLCRVTVDGAPAGAVADIRRNAGDAASSIAYTTKPVPEDGMLSLHAKDDHEGERVFVIVTADDGSLLAQLETKVGG